MISFPTPRKEGPKAHYWKLKSKDIIMQKFGQERALLIFNEFTKTLDQYCKGSYENVFSTDESLYRKSDKRIDFMINVFQKISEYTASKLSELEKERKRRLWLCT
jgi:phosphomevalonate kinase